MKWNNAWFISILAAVMMLSFPASSFALESGASASSGSKLLIYYGTPKLINNVRDDFMAAQEFAKYDYVVLGAGLESSTHTYHASTTNIINLTHSLHPSTVIFGYVDLGVSTNNFSIDTMQSKVLQWKEMGVNGIFLDDAGYDFQTPRYRLNTMLDFIHNNQLSGFVNAWRADDVMGNALDAANNPLGTATHMGPNDYYLLESFIVNTFTSSASYKNNGGYALGKAIQQRGEKAMYYKKQLGVKMMAINVVDYTARTETQIRKYFEMAEIGAMLFGLDGYGLNAANYSAGGTNRYMVLDHQYNANYKSLASDAVNYSVNSELSEFKKSGYTIHDEPGSHWWNYRQPN